MKDILYTVALNNNGNLIKANDAEKGGDFFCPVCRTEVILRKSGKTGKGTKRPHFAHRTLTPNCTPETALHYSFKNLLADKRQQHITTHKPLEISWECQFCNEAHSGNLLKKIKSVKLEYNMSVCQPDIALFDSDSKVFAVVEVVVKHKPDDNVMKFFQDNNIILIQINLKSDNDIDELDCRIANPDLVVTCFNPKCKICGNFQHKAKMIIIDGDCWNCQSKMKVAVKVGGLESGCSSAGPEEFTKQEIEFARSKGVIIKEHYSHTADERYLANTCSKCGTFIGKMHLSANYESPASFGELPSTTFDIGYYCGNCLEAKYKNDEEL